VTDPGVYRKKKGISLPAIAAATKISVRYLEAIETRDFKRLPGGAYGISYIRQYAQAIGYDPRDLVESFRRFGRPERPIRPRAMWILRLWGRIRSMRHS